MTLQDFTEAIDNNLITFAQNVIPSLLPLFAALFVIFLGFIASFLVKLTINQISSLLGLEKYLLKTQTYTSFFKETGMSFTNTVSQVTWWITLLLFIFASLDVLGLEIGFNVLSRISSFLPVLAEAFLVLLLGSLLAYLVFVLATVFGHFSKLPLTNLFSRALVSMVILFTLFQTLFVFGISDEIVRFLIIGLIFSLSIAVGFASKEVVVDYVKKFRNLKP